MKNIIKLVALINLFLLNENIYGQRTVSLRQHYTIIQTYRNSPDPVAAGLDDGENITYVKDVNNELDQFVGTWKGLYNNRNYEIQFIKKVNYKRYASAEEKLGLA